MAVSSALTQTHADLEVLVSDNASSDDTLMYLREVADPRLVILQQSTDIGMAGNFNACLRHATGEFFLMLSDDDLLESTAVESLVTPLIYGLNKILPEKIGICWCPCAIINSTGETQWITDSGPEIESPAALIVALWNGNRGPRFSSVMVRTADALAVGGYHGKRYGDLCDMGNWAAAALRHEYAVCIGQPLVRYRTHAASTTRSAACRDWQRWGESLFDDLQNALRRYGVKDRTIRSLRRNMLANLTVTVLLPSMGQPGWIKEMLCEVLHAWRYFLTLYVVRRLFSEFWKLAGFWQPRRQA